MKKGDFRIDPILFAILLVLAVALVIWFIADGFSYLAFAVNLTTFEVSVPEGGVSMIGIDMSRNELSYYTENGWRPIDEETRTLVLGDYEINTAETKNALFNFYVLAERRPMKFNISVNHWRWWEVTKGNAYENLITIFPHTKKGFAGPLVETEYIEVDSLNVPIFRAMREGVPNFAQADLASGEALESAARWRDQILEGRACEKLIALNLKEKGNFMSRMYTVRKIDNYIFIQLDKPSLGEGDDKWAEIDCFDIGSYTEENLELGVSSAQFSYTEYDSFANNDERAHYNSNGQANGWTYNTYGYDDIYRQIRGADFYDGLIMLARPNGIFYQLNVAFNYGGRNDQGVFIDESRQSIDVSSVAGKEWDNLENSQINSFIYKVLDEYNRRILPREIN